MGLMLVSNEVVRLFVLNFRDTSMKFNRELFHELEHWFNMEVLMNDDTSNVACQFRLPDQFCLLILLHILFHPRLESYLTD